MDPFETLLDIERNCKAYAANIPSQIVTERNWLGIGFRSSNFNFVCSMQEVSEVLTWPMVTEVPGAHPWFRGVANLRSRILPVTDLQGFVTGKAHKENTFSRVLVVNDEGASYGFSVEQVLGIERFFGDEIKPANFEEINQYLLFSEGAFEREHKPWVILSFNSIIKSTEFYHVITTKMEIA